MSHVLIESEELLEYNNVQIYFMDCVEGMKQLVRTASIQSIITDPPYGIGFSGKQGEYRRKEENVVNGYVEIEFDKYYEFSKSWLTQAYRVLKQKGTCYAFCPHQHIHTVIQAGLDVGFIYADQLIYIRPFPLYKERGWVTSHYNIILFAKSEDYLYNMIESYQKNLFYAERDFQNGTDLAPTRLCKKSVYRLIRAASNKGDTILEPFVGSGTVPFCAWNLGRKCIGFELNTNMRSIIDSMFTSDLTDMMAVEDVCPECGASLESNRESFGKTRFKCSECGWKE